MNRELEAAEAAQGPVSSQIRDLNKKRGAVRGRLTLFTKFLASIDHTEISERQLLELKLRRQSASALMTEFNNYQNALELLTPESTQLLEQRELFEDGYFSALADADFLLEKNAKETRDVSKCNSNSLIKLPTISLPTFDGSYDNWLEFRDTYLSMIHNSNNLDSIQKFHYLRSALTGGALQVIKALEFSAANYTIAWDLLENRYNNTCLLIHNHVKALFSMQSNAKESPVQIRRLIDHVLKNLRSLKTLGEPTESWDTLVIYMILSKLDCNTEKDWEQYKMTISKSKQKLSLQDLIDFLKQKADMLEMIKVNNSSSSHPKISQEQHKKSVQKINSLVVTKNNKFAKRRVCKMCSQNHSLYSCKAFLDLSEQDKIQLVESKNLCKNCLREGHIATDCHFGPCRQCNRKHNSALQGECSKNSALISIPTQQSSSEQTDPQATSTTLHTSAQVPFIMQQNNKKPNFENKYTLEPVLLPTALVEVLGSDGIYYKARALLDSGSQHCIITRALCKKVNAQPIQSAYQIAGVGQSVMQSTHTCEIKLKSLIGDYKNKIICLILPNITSTLPSVGIDPKSIALPENVVLADPSFGIPSQIDILIGANHFWDLLLTGYIRLANGPCLQETKLGWIVSGPIYRNDLRVKQSHCNFVQSCALDEQLKKFWEIEELPKSGVIQYSPDERACEDLFISTHERTEDGRFSVRIPLKESADSLGDSYHTARDRFLSLERKLDRSPQYKEMYTGFMQEYLSLGHMTRIEQYNSPHYFLPHHGVFRETSVTTKLRVVFNASQNSLSGKSLNDIQMAGPPLQNDLFAILLRFRQYRYVACSDIEKFFRQILIQCDQRNLQLILWRENSSDPLSVYQLNTITYGTASAPYLSIRCVRQLAFECDDELISEIILNDFYVDDFITGADCKVKLTEICKKVTDVCLSGCFPLRKWIFNSPDLVPEVVREDGQTKYLSLGENCSSKTLGLGWHNNSDKLHFTSKVSKDDSKVTKRKILSVVSQIYDPIGLLSPAIISAKILLQKLWLCKVGWDDSLPQEIVLCWVKFLESLSNLHKIRIPRHVIGQNPESIELHIFTDASEAAYGACAYIRTICSNGEIVINLLCSKTRVAPIKPVSVPRLELCGALIGAKLKEKIVNSLRVVFTKVVFWTDSTIVLGWLRMSPHLLKTFVQNRVVEINELAGNATFLHISGKTNPADILSRGICLDELSECDLWWHGPLFLRDYECSIDNNIPISSSDLPELKSKFDENISLTVTSASQSDSPLFDTFNFNRFSSWKKLQHVVAFILRFVNNVRSKQTKCEKLTGALSIKELDNSVLLITRIVQRQSFPTEYNCLLNKLPLKSSRNLSSLNVFMDEKNIIRVGGRLVNSPDFSYSKKHPVLICAKHYVTQLIFRQYHFNLFHAGPQLLLSHIRDSWWPLSGRNLAKKTVRLCIMCVRMSGKIYQPIMGNLPSERLQSGFPFIISGVDYAGPLYMLNRKGRGSRLEKCYLCLFVCFATRAVHLELVTSLTSEGYMLALKRFISRRGKPLKIFSDNGRNFVGATREFRDFLHNERESIVSCAADNQIDFNFIPPYAPHFGGLWEAGVKSCKHHITRAVGNAKLTYEELSTVLAQIEAVLNSRPMHPMSSDPNDLSPLTPAHFILGRPLTSPACDNVTSAATHTLNRYQKVELIRQQFWKRWSKEYISELQRRVKWKTNHGDIQPNAMVLIKEDNTPPLRWCLGRVMSVSPGQDGISRVASLRTATGMKQRAFSKLCPLPVSVPDAEPSCGYQQSASCPSAANQSC